MNSLLKRYTPLIATTIVTSFLLSVFQYMLGLIFFDSRFRDDGYESAPVLRDVRTRTITLSDALRTIPATPLTLDQRSELLEGGIVWDEAVEQASTPLDFTADKLIWTTSSPDDTELAIEHTMAFGVNMPTHMRIQCPGANSTSECQISDDLFRSQMPIIRLDTSDPLSGRLVFSHHTSAYQNIPLLEVPELYVDVGVM